MTMLKSKSVQARQGIFDPPDDVFLFSVTLQLPDKMNSDLKI